MCFKEFLDLSILDFAVTRVQGTQILLWANSGQHSNCTYSYDKYLVDYPDNNVEPQY